MLRVDQVLLLTVGGLFGLGSTVTAADEVDKVSAQPSATGSSPASYEKRFTALKTDDLQGHYELAKWCRARKRYGLLQKQCQYILKLNPNHTNAKLLLSIAREELAKKKRQKKKQKPAAGSDTSKSSGTYDDGVVPARFVSDADIQELRFAELSRKVPLDKVMVKFHNDVLERFVKTKMQSGDWNPQDRTIFMRLKPWQQLFQIVRVSSIDAPASESAETDELIESPADAYKEDIEIRSDPRVFSDFRRVVLPIITRGCATAHCHGSINAPVFRLYRDRGRREQPAYTNFLVLDSLRSGQQMFINRDQPADSLLLQYLLPRDQAEHHHSTKIKPVVKRRTDRSYRQVANWIGDMFTPHTKYRITWKPPGARDKSGSTK